MKKYTPEQIVMMLREAQTGEAFCRRKDISEMSYYCLHASMA